MAGVHTCPVHSDQMVCDHDGLVGWHTPEQEHSSKHGQTFTHTTRQDAGTERSGRKRACMCTCTTQRRCIVGNMPWCVLGWGSCLIGQCISVCSAPCRATLDRTHRVATVLVTGEGLFLKQRNFSPALSHKERGNRA
jgi:hypothetical protein